ncbi:MAG TPA: DMT family transporter [Methylomirabilota bacterium]|nr:DMT family transporter [Methylomirabilota bacterium]
MTANPQAEKGPIVTDDATTESVGGVSERAGILAAIVSSALGGTAVAMTRYLHGPIDAVTLAAFRFGIAFVLLLPLALASQSKWPQGRDWLGVAALGVLFFGIFIVIYNVALHYTTAARGSLALSTLPFVTMLVAALCGREALTGRKTTGVLIAITGVALALGTGLATAPVGAWRGDLFMSGGTLCMALYTVWSRPLMLRSSRLGFLTAGMGLGSTASALVAWYRGGFAATYSLSLVQWLAVLLIGTLGGAAAFYLWVYALERTTPTRMANTITVNPITASLIAALLIGEAIGLSLILGMVAVGVGIWIASTEQRGASEHTQIAVKNTINE